MIDYVSRPMIYIGIYDTFRDPVYIYFLNGEHCNYILIITFLDLQKYK